ncbi:DUF982 domain-containing protein [Rhizobium lusitanum]|jgi:hypothetical protein|uniref:DUF982 domain-containing protein n=1 Tax=Rhizobium lusitanum TaxID=293958 RepID=UPI00056B1AD3|nr:DUF982 domain-containing protein [Rhizobium lusitanum]NTJ08117.1 DUF982 domain-containing protein [Rhizobium lusitanum]
MNMIIMTSGVRWNEPVYLRIGYGMPERIRSPKDALNHLLFRWPTVRGEKYSTARHICSAAEGNSLLHNEARMAFVEACVEADVLD